MGQKGKFVVQRAGYGNFWHDMWYSSINYRAIYFQNLLIKDFIYYLLFIGITSTSLFNMPLKKITFMTKYVSRYIRNYTLKSRSRTKNMLTDLGYIRPLRGVYLTKFHVIKLFNNIIVYCSGYKWRKRFDLKLYRTERRLNLFYASLLLLDSNV